MIVLEIINEDDIFKIIAKDEVTCRQKTICYKLTYDDALEFAKSLIYYRKADKLKQEAKKV
jgi:hypothetical protein